MSIEDTVAEALAELREMLGDGVGVEEAVRRAAVESGLKPEVVRLRAEKAWGSLDAMQVIVANERMLGARKAELLSAVRQYCESFYGAYSQAGPSPDLQLWLEERLGRSLVADEILFARTQHQSAFHRFALRELDKLFDAED